MARASLAALSLGMVVLVGCGGSEIDGFHGRAKAQEGRESANAATKVAEAAAMRASEEASAKLAKAEALSREALSSS